MRLKLNKFQLVSIILLCLVILGGSWILGYQKGNRTSKNTCSTDNDCALFDTSAINTMSVCCGLNRCSDYSKDTVQAVNTQWLIAQKINTCSNKRIMCPMIAVMCTKQIIEIQRSYHPQCVKNVCEKIKAG